MTSDELHFGHELMTSYIGPTGIKSDVRFGVTESDDDEDFWISAIDFRACPSPEDWSRIRTLRSIVSLGLYSDNFSDGDIFDLPASLTELTIHSAGVSARGFQQLSRLQNLQSLTVMISHQSHACSGWDFLTALKALAELAITDGVLGTVFFERLNSCKQLNRVSFSKITGFPQQSFCFMDCDSSISELSFWDCEKLPSNMSQQVATLRVLRVLQLIRCEIGCDWFADARFRLLKSLSVSQASFSGKSLRGLEGFPSIRSLLLPHTATDDSALATLASVERLRHLDVNQTNVTRTGVLRAAQSNPKLAIYALDSLDPFHHDNWSPEYLHEHFAAEPE